MNYWFKVPNPMHFLKTMRPEGGVLIRTNRLLSSPERIKVHGVLYMGQFDHREKLLLKCIQETGYLPVDEITSAAVSSLAVDWTRSSESFGKEAARTTMILGKLWDLLLRTYLQPELRLVDKRFLEEIAGGADSKCA